MERVMRIALLGNTRDQASRLGRHLPFAHEFVDPAEAPQDVDVVLALRFERRDAERIRCRLLHTPGAGVDGIDFSALPDDCAVCNVFEHEGPIAEFVLLAMLEHAIGLGAMTASFSPEAWSEIYRTRRPHQEIAGKTVGLVGLGHIGRGIALRAKAFGMRVHAVTSSSRGASAEIEWLGMSEQLDELLAAADFVVVACPLTERTRGMIGAAQLAVMKPTAVLINIARAEIVAEEALFRALQSGAIGGAVLDVWYAYPSPNADQTRPSRFPFHKLANVRCTPHSSAWTEALFDRRYAIIADNIARLRSGEPLRNLVRAPLADRAG
jgi:phosphoglycerate dehydrogenase-like enzyme